MKVQRLREKSVKELSDELLSLLREYFNLRMKITNGQIRQTHLIRQVRRNIARVKTLMNESKKAKL